MSHATPGAVSKNTSRLIHSYPSRHHIHLSESGKTRASVLIPPFPLDNRITIYPIVFSFPVFLLSL